MIPCSYWALTCSAVSPSCTAFMVSVRQARVLPPASFRFPVAGDTLAFGYILPTAGRIRDFHPLERAPAGRTKKAHRSHLASDLWVLYRTSIMPHRSQNVPMGHTPLHRSSFCVKAGKARTIKCNCPVGSCWRWLDRAEPKCKRASSPAP